MSAAAGPGPFGLYVHIPFCESKCSYRHFAIDPRRPDDAREDRYLSALLAEMAASSAPPAGADTLYFGGGTPTLMAPARLARVVTAARERFSMRDDAEVTVEANPRDLDAAGYAALRALGATRLSLGGQSFDDAVLREMGRPHAAADIAAAVRAAREAGLGNLSLDLLLGWPSESPERWRRNLEWIARLAPEHVSLYVLEVEGKTLVAHRHRRGGLQLPDDDLVADLYLETVDTLAAQGLRRYEISNFARPGFESRHNAKYWDDQPFLASGCPPTAPATAGGGGTTTRLAPIAAPSRPPVAPPRAPASALFTGLRRDDGIELEAFAARFGVDPRARYGEGLDRAQGPPRQMHPLVVRRHSSPALLRPCQLRPRAFGSFLRKELRDALGDQRRDRGSSAASTQRNRARSLRAVGTRGSGK